MAKPRKRDHVLAFRLVSQRNKNILKQASVSMEAVFNEMKSYEETECTLTKLVAGR